MSSAPIEFEDFHWLLDILQSLEVGLVVLDMDYKVLVWNGFMENHSGINGAAIHEKCMFDYVKNLPREWLEKKVEDAIVLRTPVFSTWEQRQYLFQFKATRPFTGMSEYMYRSDGGPLANERGEISLALAGEIVRCRDCKFYDTDWESEAHPGRWWCDESWHYREPDGFCKWGERRQP